jgi:uncharacterized paraquat-inducible protein A
MKKIKSILSGWFNLITRRKKDQAQKRLTICGGCELKEQMMGVEVCGACHCPLQAKVRAKGESCPLNKW